MTYRYGLIERARRVADLLAKEDPVSLRGPEDEYEHEAIEIVLRISRYYQDSHGCDAGLPEIEVFCEDVFKLAFDSLPLKVDWKPIAREILAIHERIAV